MPSAGSQSRCPPTISARRSRSSEARSKISRRSPFICRTRCLLSNRLTIGPRGKGGSASGPAGPSRTYVHRLMIPFLLALAVAPWVHPLSFRSVSGWQAGAKRTDASAYVGAPYATAPLESAAWTARDVRYRDAATADPPNKTIAHLPARGIIVWAVIYAPATGGRPIQLDLRRARHLACCDGPVRVAGGVYEITACPHRAYSLIVRIPTSARPQPRASSPQPNTHSITCAYPLRRRLCSAPRPRDLRRRRRCRA